MDRIPLNAIEDEAMKMGDGTGVAPAETDLNYEVVLPKLKSLNQDWAKEGEHTERRRRTRNIEVDVEALRAAGTLKPDETIIGVRVIDENIKKERPLILSYLTQSERLAVFTSNSGRNPQPRQLEVNFTKKMTYSRMLNNLIKCHDGASTHGWDSVEVTYDPSKPAHCGIEHIGHNNLLFSWKAKDAQADEIVMRRFQVTSGQLKSWVRKHGFDPKQVNALLAKDKEMKIPEPQEIFKVWIKNSGDEIIYVAWVSLSSDATTYLKAPTPLDLGRRGIQEVTEMQPVDVGGVKLQQPVKKQIEFPLPETQYPIRIYVYDESENECITDQKGRVFFDRPWQDAQIALRSTVVNGALRSSNLFFSTRNPSISGAIPKKIDLRLEHGCIYSEPLDAFTLPYPSPDILRAADNLDVRKASETGNTASAVINREDSRKTATELKSAEKEQGKLSMSPLFFFGSFMREVLGLAWYIVQEQCRRNVVILVPFDIVQQDPMTGQTITLGTVNHPMVLDDYDIKPAGDTDVLQRAERLQRELNAMPIMQTTPAWPEFLKDLIRDFLPENAEKYIRLIEQAEANKDQMILALSEMLKAAVTNPDGSIKPEFADKAQFLQQIFSQLPQNQQNPNESSSNSGPVNNRQGTGTNRPAETAGVGGGNSQN